MSEFSGLSYSVGLENAVVGNDVGRQDDEDDEAVKAATDRVRDLRGRREARDR